MVCIERTSVRDNGRAPFALVKPKEHDNKTATRKTSNNASIEYIPERHGTRVGGGGREPPRRAAVSLPREKREKKNGPTPHTTNQYINPPNRTQHERMYMPQTSTTTPELKKHTRLIHFGGTNDEGVSRRRSMKATHYV